MSDVQFDTDQSIPMSTAVGFKSAENKMAEWLMRKGLAKTEIQAQLLMLGIAVAALLVGIIGWWLTSRSTVLTPEEQQRLDASLYPQTETPSAARTGF